MRLWSTQEVFTDDSNAGIALSEQSLTEKLAEVMGRDRFELWLASDAHLRLIRNLETGAASVEVVFTSSFLCEHARRSLGKELADAVKQVFGADATLSFRVAEESLPTNGVKAAASVAVMPPATKAGGSVSQESTDSASDRLAPTFASLVVGKPNELAVRAAEQVAAGRQAGGPLVFCGPAGCGKTHLLAAVRHAFRQNFRRSRVLSLTSEQFVSHYVAAYKGEGLPSFRQKHRGAHLLLIDDLHFMAGKKATLEELHHTIDRITAAGGQVVVATCQPPGQIANLSDELQSRLRAGLFCEIGAADFATRLEIARRHCRAASLPIEENELRVLAAGVTSGAREVLGAVERLRARHELLGEVIDSALAERVASEVNRHTIRPMGMDEIQNAVCDFFGVEAKALRSKSRTKSITEPRMLAMWLSRKFTQAGWREIGEFYGGRSHSTVISAHRRIEDRIGTDTPIHRGGGTCGLEEAVVHIETALRTA